MDKLHQWIYLKLCDYFFFIIIKEEKYTSKITNVKCMSVLRTCACKKL